MEIERGIKRNKPEFNLQNPIKNTNTNPRTYEQQLHGSDVVVACKRTSVNRINIGAKWTKGV